jgi:hypothetical protein
MPRWRKRKEPEPPPPPTDPDALVGVVGRDGNTVVDPETGEPILIRLGDHVHGPSRPPDQAKIKVRWRLGRNLRLYREGSYELGPEGVYLMEDIVRPRPQPPQEP